MLGDGGVDNGGGVGGSILFTFLYLAADRVGSGARISGSCLIFNAASRRFVMLGSQHDVEDAGGGGGGGGFFMLTAIPSSSVT